MPKIKYIAKNFHASTMSVIEAAVDIIEDYAARGFDLTLRQLYYQFVARDLIPNRQKEYNRLGSIINDARLAGLIDWDHLVDRTRNLKSRSHWNSPEEIIYTVSMQYYVDHWKGQKIRAEVWIEKDALVGILDRPCSPKDVPYFSCRGYVSQSEMWSAAQRIIERYEQYNQETVILHLGDHDPSGIDMSRDIQDRLSIFCDCYAPAPDVKRIALNMEQIKELNPPPNPAKVTDSRFAGYLKVHGSQSWELDALPPEYIEQLITNEIEAHIYDKDRWKEAVKHVGEQRKLLASMAEKYNEIVEFIS